MLYTAQAYIRAQQSPQQQQAAQKQLAQLVRCPHLSHFWLISALRTTDDNFVPKPFKKQAGALLAFLLVQPKFKYDSERFLSAVPDAPRSWVLGPRQLQPAPRSVSVSWELCVSELQEACIRAASTQTYVKLVCPSRSAPLCGVAYTISAECKGSSRGTQPGLFIKAQDVSADVFCGIAATIKAGSIQRSDEHDTNEGTSGRGWSNFFKTGHMAGGWDESVWASKGLPTTGVLTIKATLSKCC